MREIDGSCMWVGCVSVAWVVVEGWRVGINVFRVVLALVSCGATCSYQLISTLSLVFSNRVWAVRVLGSLQGLIVEMLIGRRSTFKDSDRVQRIINDHRAPMVACQPAASRAPKSKLGSTVHTKWHN